MIVNKELLTPNEPDRKIQKVTNFITTQMSVLHFLINDLQETSSAIVPPCCLQQTVCPVASMESRRRLRSVTSSDLMAPVTRRTTLGDRAFAVAGPQALNNLPDAIRQSPSLETFKRSLNSHLFLHCFLLSLSYLVFV